MDVRDTWRRNFVLLLVWILFYQVTQIVILDFLPVSVRIWFVVRVSGSDHEATHWRNQLPCVR